MTLSNTHIGDTFLLANCPGCKQEFPAANIWAEVIQAKELENRRDLGDYIIFMCPLCGEHC